MEEIRICDYNVDGVVLHGWKFCQDIVDYQNTVSKESGRWMKSQSGEWLYWCDWKTAGILCGLFMTNGFDTTYFYDLLLDYQYNLRQMPLKQLRPDRYYASGWITLEIISATKVDLSKFSGREYQWRREGEKWHLAIRTIRLDTWIAFFESEHFNVMPLINLRNDLIAGKFGKPEYIEHTRAVFNPAPLQRDKTNVVESIERTYAYQQSELFKPHKSEPVHASEGESGRKIHIDNYPPVCEPKTDFSSYQLIDINSLDLPFVPYDFQLKDAAYMLKQKRIINASDMGLGKTFESILVGESIPMRKLVVCPASLRINWKREIQNVNPNADISIVYSDKEPMAGSDWTIIGYPTLLKYARWLYEEDFQAIFFDEAHYIKAINKSGKPNSKRAIVAMNIAENAEYVYPITGTPKANRNKDLFNLLRVVDHPLARSHRQYFNFGRYFCNGYQDAYGWHMEGNSNDYELHNLIKDYMIRRLKKDVLPGLTKQRILLSVDADLRQYEEEFRKYQEEKDRQLDEEDMTVMGHLQKARQALAIAKVGQTMDFVNESIIAADESVVIVTCFTGVVEAIKNKYKDDCVCIVGGMSDKAKQESIDLFQSGKKKILVMNVIAGGVGVTLTRAHIMVINDMDWVIGNVTQAEDRICRTGQDQHCLIYYMICEDAEIDRILRKSLTRKSNTLNRAVDGGKGTSVKLIDEAEM